MKEMFKRRLMYYLRMDTEGLDYEEREHRRHTIEVLNHLINCDKTHATIRGKKPTCGWLKRNEK